MEMLIMKDSNQNLRNDQVSQSIKMNFQVNTPKM